MLLTTSASVNSVRTKLGGAALLLLLLPPLVVAGALPKVGPCSRATGAGDLHDMKVLLHAAIAGVGEGTNDGSAGHASMMCRRGGRTSHPRGGRNRRSVFSKTVPLQYRYVGGSPDLHVRHVHLRSGAHEHVDPGQLPVPHRVAGPLDLDESRRAARGAEGLGASAQGPRGAAGEQVRGGGAPCWGPT